MDVIRLNQGMVAFIPNPNLKSQVVLESLSNNYDDGYENAIKKGILAASNVFAVIPCRSICQMLANVSGVEF